MAANGHGSSPFHLLPVSCPPRCPIYRSRGQVSSAWVKKGVKYFLPMRKYHHTITITNKRRRRPGPAKPCPIKNEFTLRKKLLMKLQSCYCLICNNNEE